MLISTMNKKTQRNRKLLKGEGRLVWRGSKHPDAATVDADKNIDRSGGFRVDMKST